MPKSQIVNCVRCMGTGYIEDDTKLCPTCDGCGYKIEDVEIFYDKLIDEQKSRKE